MVLNPEDVNIRLADVGVGSVGVPPGDYAHVVITSSTYVSSFQSLVSWNTKKGVPDTVVTTEWIYANYSGSDNQAKIRAFIKDANTNWGTIWFLLGGDISVVPYKTKYFSITGEYVPGDTYYSDFDDDWFCEVFVGRSSTQSTSEVSTFLNKVLTYEKNPQTTDYPLEVLLLGFDADASTKMEQLMESIDANFIPSRFDPVNKVYDSHSGNHETNTKTFLNAGQNIVVHADHGNIDYIGTGEYWHGWGLYSSEIDALTNGSKQSIMYTLACDPCAFDYEDCLGEHWVKNVNGGGVSFNGNSRYGWYSPGSPNSYSGHFEYDWCSSLFQQNQYHLGQTLADHKNDNPPGSDQYKQYIFWELTCLGEPEMAIWLDTPTAMTVTHPTIIPTGSQSFTVTVKYGGSPLANALVCLQKTGEVYVYGLTGSDGTKTFTINPTTPGTMNVTVTAQNHLPYEGTCTVGVPDISITLTPDATEIPRGGTLGYTVTLTNNTASSQTFQYWADVTLPNGNEYSGNPVFGPRTVTLAAGKTRSGHISHPVPNSAPLGTYTYTGRIGTHPSPVWNEDSFEFTVTP